MKTYRRTLPVLALLMLLNGCASHAQIIETELPVMVASEPSERPPTEESRIPETEVTNPVRESVEETKAASVTEPAKPAETVPQETEHQPNTTEPAPTQPPKKEPEMTEPPATEPPATEAPATEPEETAPPTTPPAETISPETIPKETKPTQTEPPTTEEPKETESTEPEVTDYSYAFKREVASYAAMYLNQYRGSPCTVLTGMSQVAQYRASQLTWNFAHSTADKRSALAYYEYGRWIDATLAGLEESDSYYESDTSEAICRYFHGDTAEELGKAIADLIRNSSSHWCYVGDTSYSYMGVGIEYRDGWYACVMVGTENYG